MDIRQSIGSKIHMARKRLGLSQNQLAEKLGKTRTAISSYEIGAKAIKVTELPDLAAALGVPVWYFFDESPTDVVELQAMFRSLDPYKRQVISQVIRGLIAEDEPVVENQYDTFRVIYPMLFLAIELAAEEYARYSILSSHNEDTQKGIHHNEE